MAPDEKLRILVVEDDEQTAEYIFRGLSDSGHKVHVTNDGLVGLRYAISDAWDLLIIDRMLPGLEGLQVVRQVRGLSDGVAVLLLTAMGGVDDRVQGLNAGADDYLVKPFSLSELLARAHALGRRSRRGQVESRLHYADLEIDLLNRSAKRGGQALDLLPREFQLLEYFMRHAEQTVTRSMLLEHVWDVHFEPNTNVVETHISRLRGKVDRAHGINLIHTLRGSGYCLRE